HLLVSGALSRAGGRMVHDRDSSRDLPGRSDLNLIARPARRPFRPRRLALVVPLRGSAGDHPRLRGAVLSDRPAGDGALARAAGARMAHRGIGCRTQRGRAGPRLHRAPVAPQSARLGAGSNLPGDWHRGPRPRPLPAANDQAAWLVTLMTGFAAAIPYVVGTIGMVICGYITDRMHERRWNLFFTCLAAVVGLLAAALLSGSFWALAGLSVATIGFYGMKTS